MEKKVVKTDRKYKSKIKYVDLVGDVIVPDVKPDIVRIASVSSNVYVQKEEKASNRLRLDGKVDSYISYISDNEETRSIESSFSFVEQIECEGLKENSKTKIEVIIDSSDVKLLNERKVQVRIMLKVIVIFFEEYDLELPDFMNNDNKEFSNLEMLESKIKLKNIFKSAKGKSNIKEIVELDDKAEISEIIKLSKEIVNIENKISINKILSKADIKLKIMYLTENGNLKIKEVSVPAMTFIDIEGVKEDLLVDVNYKIKNLSLRLDQEKRNVVEIISEIEVECECYKEEEIMLIEDMYSLDKDVTFLKKEINALECCDKSLDTISVFERIKLDGLANILDIDARVKDVNENGEGKLELEIFYEVDNKQVLEVKKEFLEFRINTDNKTLDIEEVSFNVLNKKFTQNEEYVDCDITIEIVYNKFKERVVNILDQIEVKDKEDHNSIMCMYFIKPEDTLWSIAKQFNIKKDLLIRINELEDEKLIPGEKLYIIR